MWQDEGFRDFEVPKIVDFMVEKKWIKDISWKNDTSPSFGLEIPGKDGHMVRLWVDHPLSMCRELEDLKRFSVAVGEPGSTTDYSFETNDLQEVLLIFIAQIHAHVNPSVPDLHEIVELQKESRR